MRFASAVTLGSGEGTRAPREEINENSPIATTGSYALAFCLLFGGCRKSEPIDEANPTGLPTADLPQITADIFKPMDGGIELTPEQIMGRNTWNLWTSGNQYFWDRIAREGYGLPKATRIPSSFIRRLTL